MQEFAAEGRKPEYLFWVGYSGSYDPRAQKISVALVRLLNEAGVDFAILGDEEACTGDPARRAGNEFLFQMLAHQNIGTLEQYGITKIIASCPHCFNTLKNEYPALGGHYDVIHHTQLINQLLKIELKEMSRSRSNGLCCGAGGAQMFKEDEPGDKRINIERAEEAIETGAATIVANCPFCMTMLSDGVKAADKQDEVMVYDLSELVLSRIE